MFSSRKPLAIVLALVMLLAMVVPAAIAAPEWVHGISITSPTTRAPAYVNPDTDASVGVAVTIPVVGTQVDNVRVVVRLLQKYIPDPNNVVIEDSVWIPANKFVTGDNNFTIDFAVNDSVAPGGELEDGWYDLKVCVRDIDPDRDLFCATQVNAVLAEDSYPKVDLEKPGVEEYQGATFVTGQAYLMVGTAVDNWGITRVEFQYCDASNFPFCRMKESASWIKIADGVPTPGIANQWQATFDSSMVPDDFSYIRMCAWNLVGLSNCEYGPDPEDATRQDAHKVFVNNRVKIDLEPGWNLISSPLLPYNSDMASVLMHLIDHGTVKSVWTYDPSAATKWTSWMPGGMPGNLTALRDGKGYWVEMAAEDDLTIVGTWNQTGGMQVPPEYKVFDAWNLIGYTHWGRPTFFPTKTMGDYLGPVVTPATQALYRYDANTEHWIAVYGFQHLNLGAGYWLATTVASTIRP